MMMRKDSSEGKRVAWVARAMGKAKEERAFCHVLQVEKHEEERWIVATDGRRLHAARMEGDMEVAHYSLGVTESYIILTKLDDPVNFPEWRHMIPEFKKPGFFANGESCLSKDVDTRTPVLPRIIGILAGEIFHRWEAPVSVDYLSDVLKAEITWHVNGENEKKPIVFRHVTDGFLALVMPIMDNRFIEEEKGEW